MLCHYPNKKMYCTININSNSCIAHPYGRTLFSVAHNMSSFENIILYWNIENVKGENVTVLYIQNTPSTIALFQATPFVGASHKKKKKHYKT